MKPQTPEIITRVIDNFSGRLTRIDEGALNSGYAKFEKSFGYNPFIKPGKLTWMVAPEQIGAGQINGLVVAAKSRFETPTGSAMGVPYVYAQTNEAATTNLYKILVGTNANPRAASIIATASVMNTTPIFNKGGSIEFFQFDEKIYVGSDDQVNNIRFDGSQDAVVNTASPGSVKSGYVQGMDRPMQTFQGKLVIGNGPTIAVINSTNQLTSSIMAVSSVLLNGNQASSAINPPLPQGWFVKDLKESQDFNYLDILASRNAPVDLLATPDNAQSKPNSETALFRWNGTDAGITAGEKLPLTNATALLSVLSDTYIWGNDVYGPVVVKNGQRILTLPYHKSPYRNAVGTNGNFVFWMCIEGEPLTATTYARYATLYYYGSFDEQSPVGLYRLLRYSTDLSGGSPYEVPVCIVASNEYAGLQTGTTEVRLTSLPEHFFSLYSYNANADTNSEKLFRFALKVNTSWDVTPVAGVYETQNEVFAKKVSAKQIRVYCDPTVENNGVQVDLIGGDGEVISGSTLTYSFVAGTDPTKLQGALTRIDFNPTSAPGFSYGVRVTNTGNRNMGIDKVEVDFVASGK